MKLFFAFVLSACAVPIGRVIAQTTAPPIATLAQVQPVVALVGAVAKPGAYQLLPRETLPELIARAGPLAGVSATTISLRREGKTLSIIADSAAEFALHEGDIITVSARISRVTVIGAVKSPGSYDVPDKSEISVEAAIALAGGLNVDAAKYTLEIAVAQQQPAGNLKVIDKYVLPADLKLLRARGPLQDGDVIVVSRVSRFGLQLLKAP